MTPEDIMIQVGDDVGATLADPVRTKYLRYINGASLDLYAMPEGDWPDRKVFGASFTTDGSESYDLQDSYVVATDVGRVVDKSIRIGSFTLVQTTLDLININDPLRTHSGSARKYALPKINNLFLWPWGSSGETVNLNYISIPAEILLAAKDDEITTWQPERHNLLLLGAMWRAMKVKDNSSGWLNMKKEFEDEARKQLRGASPARIHSFDIIPSKF